VGRKAPAPSTEVAPIRCTSAHWAQEHNPCTGAFGCRRFSCPMLSFLKDRSGPIATYSLEQCRRLCAAKTADSEDRSCDNNDRHIRPGEAASGRAQPTNGHRRSHPYAAHHVDPRGRAYQQRSVEPGRGDIELPTCLVARTGQSTTRAPPAFLRGSGPEACGFAQPLTSVFGRSRPLATSWRERPFSSS
jgi:hypothetical protein